MAGGGPKTKRQQYGLVVLDVDGTMVDRDLVVSPRLQRAAALVRETGAIITIATGRMLRSARPFALKLGANGPAICYQGAVTFDPEDGRIIRHCRLEPAVALEALAAVEDADAHVNVYVGDEIYVTDIDEWAAGYARRQAVDLKVVQSLRPLAQERPTLILAVAEPGAMETLAPRVRRRLEGRATVTRSLPHFCEIASSEAGKAKAVAAIAASMGIGWECVVAFGDGEGDVEMLQRAGLGVAVEGGHPQALAASDSTVAGPADDGVAMTLEALLADGMVGR